MQIMLLLLLVNPWQLENKVESLRILRLKGLYPKLLLDALFFFLLLFHYVTQFYVFYLLLLLLLSRFSRVRLCATPQMAAHQAPQSLGFSRQEHWSGLSLPSLIQALGQYILATLVNTYYTQNACQLCSFKYNFLLEKIYNLPERNRHIHLEGQGVEQAVPKSVSKKYMFHVQRLKKDEKSIQF